MTPTPKLTHQAVVGRLYLSIANDLVATPIGRIFLSPLDVILSQFDGVEPDLLYVSNERASILRDWVHGAPDLVVEVVSTSTRKRDETIKRSLYERAGVTEYWVVDPEIDVVRVYRRTGERFDRPTEWPRSCAPNRNCRVKRAMRCRPLCFPDSRCRSSASSATEARGRCLPGTGMSSWPAR